MGVGRKLEFDREETLDKAMRLFWDHGYTNTSLSELISELGISKPSLYNTFGNKENLFSACFDFYLSEYVKPKFDLLTGASETPLSDRLSNYFYGLIDLMADSDTPLGCLYVKSQAEAQSPNFPAGLSTMLLEASNVHHAELEQILSNEISVGQLPAEADVSKLSNYITAVSLGLAVQCRSGKSITELRDIADIAISSIV